SPSPDRQSSPHKEQQPRRQHIPSRYSLYSLVKDPPEQHRRPVKGLLRILAPPVNAMPKTLKTHGIQP
ncbi:hypothetical protein, partial [Komagataeibacter nataicola]|uniref:hypothetical protein n=1 Tax=Komagataeibacter nataicola TaxID=265960 RepID=UPI001B879E4F